MVRVGYKLNGGDWHKNGGLMYNINKSVFCGYNNMGGESTELLKKLVD